MELEHLLASHITVGLKELGGTDYVGNKDGYFLYGVLAVCIRWA
jgi:hypothetical protein